MRMGGRVIVLLTLISMLIGGGRVLASERLALVIGNSSYTSTAVLKNPVNDAKDIAAELRALGFEVDLGLDLDYRGFFNLVSDFRGKVAAAQATQVVFYYAGHGFQLHGLNHLVPVDAKLRSADYLAYETLQLNQIINTIRTSANQTLVVLLDACRNSPLPENLRDENTRDGLAQLQDVDRALVVFSTSPGKVSRDGIGRNGPFASALLKEMGTAALSSSDLMLRVREEVRRSTDGAQVPWELSTLSEAFYFNPAMYGVANDNAGGASKPDEAGSGQAGTTAAPPTPPPGTEGAIITESEASPEVQPIPIEDTAELNLQQGALPVENDVRSTNTPDTSGEQGSEAPSKKEKATAVEAKRGSQPGESAGGGKAAGQKKKSKQNLNTRTAPKKAKSVSKPATKKSKPDPVKKAAPAKSSVKKTSPAKSSVKKTSPAKSSVKKTSSAKPVPRDPVVIINRPRICAYGVVCF